MKLIDWWRQKTCPHRWVALYRGKMETLYRCMYCKKEMWQKI